MILLDTGPILALFDTRDPQHHEIRRFLANRREPDPIAVGSVILAEAAYLIGKRVGTRAEAEFLRWLSSPPPFLIDPLAADFRRAADLVEQYADFPLGTVDALVVATAERLGVTTIFTLDRRHFGAIRPRHCERFTLVP